MMLDCGHPRAAPEPECRVCYLWTADDRYHRHFTGRPQVAVENIRSMPCIHRGGVTGEQAVCKTCRGGTDRIKLHACALYGSCSPLKKVEGDAHWCLNCADHRPAADFWAEKDDPPCGVVVGSYGYPRLIELQIRCIRRYCGDVPILISDDVSPDGKADEIRALADQYAGVEVQVSPSRIGHAGGDMAAYYRGILWGSRLGLRVVAKFSHRFLLTQPRWLQRGARAMLDAGCPISGQPCIEGTVVYPLRTEAALLDVPRWLHPEVLAYLTPRKIGIPCEVVVWHAVEKWLGGKMHPWSVMTPNRFKRTPGVLWHVWAMPEEYHALAKEFGIELDDDYNPHGNHLRKDYIVG